MSAEAIAHQRAKSKSPSNNSAEQAPASTSSAPHPPGQPAAAGGPPHTASAPGLDDADSESDEEQWALDDAAEEVAAQHGAPAGGEHPNVPKGNVASPASVNTLVSSFVSHHPPGAISAGNALTYPVILPQRRPKSSSRGFVKAYAPLLGDCGISQEAWFDFLASFDQSIKVRSCEGWTAFRGSAPAPSVIGRSLCLQVSPIFDAVNIAAAPFHFVPFVII